jgi:hypothetical protein
MRRGDYERAGENNCARLGIDRRRHGFAKSYIAQPKT